MTDLWMTDLLSEFYEARNAGDEDRIIDLLQHGQPTIAEIGSIMLSVNRGQLHRTLRWMLARWPELLTQPNHPDSEARRIDAMLDQACTCGHTLTAIMLVDEYGANPASSFNGQQNRPLNNAAGNGNLELVRFLLDRGAPANESANGCYTSYALLLAAYRGYTDVVRLLVERGALLDGLNAFGLSPMDYARMGGHPETIEHLRSVGARESWEIRGQPKPPPLDPRAKSLAVHLERQEGIYDQMGIAAQDDSRPDWPIAVRRYHAVGGVLLVTEGLADPPQVAERAETHEHAEVYAAVPVPEEESPAEDWPESHPEQRWVAEWLLRLARHPAWEEGWGGPFLVANGEPPEPLDPQVPFTSWLVYHLADRPADRWERRDGILVRLYRAYPIHTAERDFARRHGIAALLERMDTAGVTPLIAIDRPSVV